MAEKAVFFDRDDTLIEDPGYISAPDQVKLIEGVPESLAELRGLGYRVVVVSNQSGVARGLLTEEDLGKIHARLNQLLTARGAGLDAVYYCPFHPEGTVEKYRRESDWRKPNPGMLLAAAADMRLDLGRSWVIGDSSRDIEAGIRAGCKTILIGGQAESSSLKAGCAPDYRAADIAEAVTIIRGGHRSSRHGPQPAPTGAAAETEAASGPAPTSTEPEGKTDVSGLLQEVLRELRRIGRNDMFQDFSFSRLVAQLLQIVVIFCLVAAVWLIIRPGTGESTVLLTLAFAMLLQLMSLTFYIMHLRR